MEFRIAGGVETILDSRCFMTDDDKCLFWCRPRLSPAHGTTSSPLTREEFTARVEASIETLQQLTDGIGSGRTGGKRRWHPEYGDRLGDLVEALQRDPLLDDA